jgi:hypothetical protein
LVKKSRLIYLKFKQNNCRFISSKAGLSQAEAQFREAKPAMKEINIISKGYF